MSNKGLLSLKYPECLGVAFAESACRHTIRQSNYLPWSNHQVRQNDNSYSNHNRDHKKNAIQKTYIIGNNIYIFIYTKGVMIEGTL